MTGRIPQLDGLLFEAPILAMKDRLAYRRSRLTPERSEGAYEAA